MFGKPNLKYFPIKILFFLSLFLVPILKVTGKDHSIIKWSFKTKGKILSHPVIDNDIVYFGGTDSIFYAVDANNGNLVWSFLSTGPIHSKALINGEMIYFKSGNNVYALNKVTGKEVWKYISDPAASSGQSDNWDYHSGALAIDKSTIYCGLGNGHMYGFDLQSGKIKFHIVAVDSASIKSGLAIEDSILYFGDWNGKIYAYNLDTHQPIWIHETYKKQLYPTFGQINTQLAIHGQALYFGARNPEMQVLDKTTGKKLWSYTEKQGGWISGDPLILDDTLYIGGSDNHKMMAFNANTGEKKWTYFFLNNNFSKPLPYKSLLLFTTGDAYNVYGTQPGRGYLYALNRLDGSMVNFEYIGGNIYSSLVMNKGVLYAGSEDHHFYAIDLEKFLSEPPNLKEKGYDSVDIQDVSPNPFSDQVEITYQVQYKTHVEMGVKNLAEERVKNLFSGKKEPGTYVVVWDGSQESGGKVPQGHYFIEVGSGDYIKKSLIQKK